jgi:hypothetical protein
MSTGTMQSVRPWVNSCINKINWRINWCRCQPQLKTVARDEHDGWWTEEASLMDAWAQQGQDSIYESCAPVFSVHALSLWSPGWASPPLPPGLQINWDGHKHNGGL